MAQVEFTQQLQVNYTQNVFTYIPLQATAGVYIAKRIQFIFSQDVPFLEVANSTGNTNYQYIYSTSTTIPANTISLIDVDVILTQSDISFKSSGTSGTAILIISYSFIPSTNSLSSNFGTAYYLPTTPTTGAIFTGLSPTIPTIVKSICIGNSGNEANIMVTPYLTTISTGVTSMYEAPITINAGNANAVIIDLYNPIYLTNDQQLSIQSVSLTDGFPNVIFSVYYSYSLDPTP